MLSHSQESKRVASESKAPILGDSSRSSSTVTASSSSSSSSYAPQTTVDPATTAVTISFEEQLKGLTHRLSRTIPEFKAEISTQPHHVPIDDSNTRLIPKGNGCFAIKTTTLSERLNLSYEFNNNSLLTQALTRESTYIEQPDELRVTEDAIESNARLEFWGDSIVRTVIDDILMELYPKWTPAQLTVARDTFVCKKGIALYGSALRLKLLQFARMGKSEIANCAGEGRYTIASSLMEAVIGAVFLDCARDYKCIKRFIVVHAGFAAEPQYQNLQLFKAVQNNDIEEVNYWLAQGADPNVWYPCLVLAPRPRPWFISDDGRGIAHTDDAQLTCEANALMLALYKLRGIGVHTPSIVEALLEHGAHPGKEVKASLAPLLYETIAFDNRCTAKQRKAYLELTEIFCRYVKNINERSCEGLKKRFTFLEIAIFQEDVSAVRILLKAGANPNTKEPTTGRTSLHWAAFYSESRLKSQREYESKGFFFEQRRQEHMQRSRDIIQCYDDIIKLLIRWGADTFAKDNNNRTPVQLSTYPPLRLLFQPPAPVFEFENEQDEASAPAPSDCVLS